MMSYCMLAAVLENMTENTSLLYLEPVRLSSKPVRRNMERKADVLLLIVIFLPLISQWDFTLGLVKEGPPFMEKPKYKVFLNWSIFTSFDLYTTTQMCLTNNIRLDFCHCCDNCWENVKTQATEGNQLFQATGEWHILKSSIETLVS